MSIRVGLMALALIATLADTALAQGPGGRNPNQQGNDAGAAGAALATLICVGVSILIGIGIKIWIILFIVKDAKRRGMDPTLWVLLEIFVGLVGLIVYLCVREPLLSERRGERDDYEDYDRSRRRRRRRDDDDDEDYDRPRRRDDY
jgi:hypothetical protein